MAGARGGGPEFVVPAPDVALELRRDLSAWFAEAKRDLPWRRTSDPYGVWVSEAMLQQTRVDVVLHYWPRFLKSFPTISDLARADEEKVLEAWSGLGYYRRARSLQAAARVIHETHGGVFPSDPAEALALPGVGPYTAGAVLSIALDLPEPIVDGNVERVFSRWFALDGVRSSGPLLRAAWAASRHFVGLHGDGVQPGVWSQALMELGALICTPRSPRCGECPVASRCEARARGIADELPRPKPRRAPVDVSLEIYATERAGRWLVVQRPDDGLMAGMWEFPTVEVKGPGLFPGELPGSLGSSLEPAEELLSLRHGITKHRITARVRRATLAEEAPSAGELLPVEQIEGLALTGMARKVLERLDRWSGGLGSSGSS